MTKPTLGFRVHSGWAAMVAVSGSPAQPVILDRRRIEFADKSIVGSAQPYHAAAEMELARAQVFLDQCQSASSALAREALETVLKKAGGHRVRRCAILMSSGKRPASLEATLASHAAIHTAEGEFFREAVRNAAEACGLEVCAFKEKELLDLAARDFNLQRSELEQNLAGLGKMIGPPWTQDQKLAAVAAWLAAK